MEKKSIWIIKTAGILIIPAVLVLLESFIIRLIIGAVYIIALGTAAFFEWKNRRDIQSGNEGISSPEKGENVMTPPSEIQEEEAAETPEENEDTVLNLREIFTPLRDYLGDYTKVTKILQEQLQSVISETDDAAMGLSQAFMGIHKLAKAQLKQISEVLQQFSVGSCKNVISSAQTTLQEVAKDFVFFKDLLIQGLSSIENVAGKIDHIKVITDKINDIAGKTQVLSINARIEAARAGSAGKGFAVVAGEVKKLSVESNSAIEEINALITSLMGETVNIRDKVESGIKQTEMITGSMEQHLSQTLGKLDNTNERIHEYLEDISENTSTLTKNISAIVMSLQFQDITRQKIEHVIEPLRDFAKDIDTIISNLENNGREDKSFESLHERIKKLYTMESEHEIFEKVIEDKRSGGN